VNRRTVPVGIRDWGLASEVSGLGLAWVGLGITPGRPIAVSRRWGAETLARTGLENRHHGRFLCRDWRPG
jgi:hypothetical protein